MAKDEISAVGHRIREIRKREGLTMEALADRIAEQTGSPVHLTTIAKIERSMRTISLDWVMKISRALGVQPADLVGGDAEPARIVPLVGKIAAGNWREAIQDSRGTVPVPAGEVGPNAFALEPSGDSMNLVVTDGAVVVFDPDEFELREGGIYAVMNSEGETTFKRYRNDPPRLEPCSSNPEHQPFLLGREPFTVIGRARWQMGRL